MSDTPVKGTNVRHNMKYMWLIVTRDRFHEPISVFEREEDANKWIESAKRELVRLGLNPASAEYLVQKVPCPTPSAATFDNCNNLLRV